MSARLIMNTPVMVCAPPVNERTSKWGVYSIPRLWRDVSGKLIVRVNGEQDCADQDNMLQTPTLWYTSSDEGKNWVQENRPYPTDCMQGISSPYLTLKSGDIVAVRDGKNSAIKNIAPLKEFVHPCLESILHVYKWNAIPEECRRMELLRYKNGLEVPDVSNLKLDFGEREVMAAAFAQEDSDVNEQKTAADTSFFSIDEYLKPFLFRNPYISCLTELPDGTLAGICCGQTPAVSDRYCTEIYMVTSEDSGLTWKKRSTVAAVANEVEALAFPYGYGGDGHEVSLALTTDGELLCVMRMDLSINPDVSVTFCGTMLTRSNDMGYTWSKPVPISDESVTPHIVALKNGITAVIYGRPGVHMIYSEDNMRTYSAPVSIIGETLAENRRKGISDLDCKYGKNSISYANSFVEIVSDDSFVVVYNDLHHIGDDKLYHKATLTRKITILRA